MTSAGPRAALIGGLVILVVGCTTPSSSPSGSASPHASPDGTPSAPSASPTPYPADAALLQVSVDGLRLRASASTTAQVIRSLVLGEVVRVVSGPIEASGHQWYEVVDLDSDTGWVAAGDGSTAWLAEVPEQPGTSRLRFAWECETGAPGLQPALTLLTDARMVFDEPGAPWRIRRLSDAGLAEFTARYLDAQVLQTSAEYLPELLPGITDQPGHGACLYTFVVDSDDGPIVVSSVNWFGEAEETAYYVPSPERRELDEMAHELMGIEAGLEAGGWAEPTSRGYVGPSYLVWFQSETDPSFSDLLPTDGIDWPFDGEPEAFGEGGFGPAGKARCGYLDLPQAFEFVRLLRERGADLRLDAWGGAALEADTGWLGMQMQPRTPDGYPTCADMQAGRRWGTP